MMGKILWRFTTGQHLDGRRRTDRTFWQPGKFPPRHVNWWTRKPIAHVLAWRFVPLIAGGLGWWTWDAHRTILITVLATAAPFILHNMRRNVRRFGTKRVRPAAMVTGWDAEPNPMGMASDQDIRDAVDEIGVEDVVIHESPF